jgi:hypothetical protein
LHAGRIRHAPQYIALALAITVTQNPPMSLRTNRPVSDLP